MSETAGQKARAEYMREYRKQHREELNAYQKLYRAAHPKKVAKWAKTYQKKHQGELRERRKAYAAKYWEKKANEGDKEGAGSAGAADLQDEPRSSRSGWNQYSDAAIVPCRS